MESWLICPSNYDWNWFTGSRNLEHVKISGELMRKVRIVAKVKGSIKNGKK